MTSGECAVSSDCALTSHGAARLCYEEVSFSNQSFFCDCSVWYGWTGEDCDEESGLLTYYRFSSILQTVWALFVFIVTARTLILHALYSTWKSDPVIFTGIFVLFSAFFTGLDSMTRLPALFNPGLFEVVTYRVLLLVGDGDDEPESVGVNGAKVFAYFLPLGTICFYFSAMTVIFSWFNVIAKISRFDGKESQQSVEMWTKRFKIFVGAYFFVIAALCLANMLLAIAVVVALTSFVLALTYICSTVKFIQTLERFDVVGNEKVESMIWMVRTSCILNMFCLTLVSILLIVYYVLFAGVYSNVKPGDFNYALFLRDLSLAFGMTIASYTAWYVNSMAEREHMISGVSRFSCIWAKWDSQFDKLMSSRH